MKYLNVARDLILIFLCIFIAYKTLIKRPNINTYQTKINSIERIIDTLLIKEKYYETKIKNNKITYITIIDSIVNIPDSALQRAVFITTDRFGYLHHLASGKNDSINGGNY